MNYLYSHRLPRKALTGLALPSLLVFILLFLLLLPGLPKSFAARATKASRTNNAQETPAISFAGSYRQTNLVSYLPGVALVEDRLLRNPWGVALQSNSPFWVVNNKTDCATIYHTTNFPDGEIRAQFPSNLFVPDMLIRSLDAGIITRAQALRLIAEFDRLRIKEFNRAFVLMEYFGYLRRNPDDPPDNNLNGFNFWLAKLDQFNGNFVQVDMVRAFIKSTEYRGRFGPP